VRIPLYRSIFAIIMEAIDIFKTNERQIAEGNKNGNIDSLSYIIT